MEEKIVVTVALSIIVWIAIGVIITQLRLTVWQKFILNQKPITVVELGRKRCLAVALTFPWQAFEMLTKKYDETLKVLPIIPNSLIIAPCNAGPMGIMEDIHARLKIIQAIRADDPKIVYTRYTVLGIPVSVEVSTERFFKNHTWWSIFYGPLHIPVYVATFVLIIAVSFIGLFRSS